MLECILKGQQISALASAVHPAICSFKLVTVKKLKIKSAAPPFTIHHCPFTSSFCIQGHTRLTMSFHYLSKFRHAAAGFED